MKTNASTLSGPMRTFFGPGEFDESFIEFAAALALKPNHPDMTIDRAEALIYAGDPVEPLRK